MYAGSVDVGAMMAVERIEAYASWPLWARDFMDEMKLENTKWSSRWRVTFQNMHSRDPFVIFHIDDQRVPLPSGYEKGYHGYPLSIAKIL